MTSCAPEGMPQCSPYLFYDDVDAAIAFLGEAFGFVAEFQHPDASGATCHAQIRFGEGVVMLGKTTTEGALRPVRNPKAAGSLNANVYLYVEDADGHCERSRAAGAEILMEPCDMFWGDRIYCAEDPEGQFWTFAQHLRAVAPQDMPIPPARG